MRVKTKYEILSDLQEMAAKLMRLSLEVAAMEESEKIPMAEKYHGEFGGQGVLGLEEFKEALDNLRNTKWREDSVEDYKAYMTIREAVLHTGEFLGLDGLQFSDEPKWPMDVIRGVEK